MWEQPPVIGYKVILNPEGKNYEHYIKQSEGGAGWIIGHGVSENNLKEWLKYSEFDRLNLAVYVEWENENQDVYLLSDLLPIENGFRDVTAVLFDDSLEVRGFTEKIEEIIDQQIIVKGRRIVNRYDYKQKIP